MNTPAQKKRNVRIAAEQGCVHCGRMDGIDPAHYPTRRSHGAGWGLLEFMPLCHSQHTLLDSNNPAVQRYVASLAHTYYNRMYRLFRGDPKIYFGPPERIEEVTRGHH